MTPYAHTALNSADRHAELVAYLLACQTPEVGQGNGPLLVYGQLPECCADFLTLDVLASLLTGLGHMTVDILGKATFSIRVSPLIERRDLPR